jgi:outer membrane protein insertion porin family
MPVLAQDSGVIGQIVIQGNQRIEPETIRSYMSIAEGDAFNDTKIDRSLKSLFATGLFADVAIRREGGALIVRVVENPIINRLAFEGNHRIKTEQLETEVQLRPRTVFTRTKAQGDVKRILDIYRRNGRFAATVEPKVIELPQNRVDLIFEINEGPGTYVTRIDFVGNRKFSDSALREELQTREERWYRFLTSDDTYDPDRVAYDRELLRRFYLRNGYAEFRVVSSVASLTPDRERFFLTFTIEEGERYKLGNIVVRSAIRDLKPDELQPSVKDLKTGDWYNAELIENAVQSMTNAAGTKGYAFVDIRPNLARSRQTRTIDVTFDIEEAPRVYVERVDIQGNVRTLDKVIRREFTLVEGDAFNTAKLRRSQQRLKDLDFFEKVDVTNVPSSTAADRTVIKVDVTEKSTGEISFGVGFSTSVGGLVNVGAKERNLLGRGQEVSINTQLAQKGAGAIASFTEPYFLDRRLTAGFDVFATSTNSYDFLVYSVTTAGFDFRTGYYYNDFLRSDWKYTLSSTHIHDIDPSASLYIREQAGTSNVSSIFHALTYDRRDSKVDPTTGYYLKLGNEVAGLGGMEYWLRTTASAGHYFKLSDETILLMSTNGGYIFSLNGDPVRINQRFYLGGDSLRGFRDYGVAPRDITTLDALGGMWDAAGTVEMRFPLGMPKEMGIQGKLFTDIGIIGDTDSSVSRGSVLESETPRVAVGTGLIWRSPMGPINVDLGLPVLKKPHDQQQVIHFNFGTRF